jgi:hypothetical protein
LTKSISAGRTKKTDVKVVAREKSTETPKATESPKDTSKNYYFFVDICFCWLWYAWLLTLFV